MAVLLFPRLTVSGILCNDDWRLAAAASRLTQIPSASVILDIPLPAHCEGWTDGLMSWPAASCSHNDANWAPFSWFPHEVHRYKSTKASWPDISLESDDYVQAENGGYLNERTLCRWSNTLVFSLSLPITDHGFAKVFTPKQSYYEHENMCFDGSALTFSLGRFLVRVVLI